MKLPLIFLLLSVSLFVDDINAQAVVDKFPFVTASDKIIITLKNAGIERSMSLNFRGKSSMSTSLNIQNDGNLTFDFNSALFKNSSHILLKTSQENYCEQVIDGSVGSDMLRQNSIYTLDFDRSEIGLIEDLNAQFLKDNGFKEIQSIFYKDKIELVININWKDYKFIFDLGYNGTFSHKMNKILLEKLAYGYSYNYIATSDLGVESKMMLFPFSKFYINKIGYSGALTIGENLENRVGLGFIKGFNWIIDYNDKKVYLKKNFTPIDTNIIINNYKCSIISGELVITHVRKGMRNFALGSKIDEIDGKKITSNNICEFLELLDTNRDWNNHTILIKRN